VSPRRDVSMSPEEISAFLATPRTAVLSSLGKDGSPHAAGMWFAADEREIRMWTYRKSQKAVNLERDPRCAFLVEEGMAYSELRGVLVKGSVQLVGDLDDIVAIGRELYERYTLPATGVQAEQGPIVEIERQAAKRVGLALPLEDVASWNHSKLG
jgi:PPOX class probable F420-dependent enzyme